MPRQARKPLGAIVVVLALVLAAGGYGYYREEARSMRAGRLAELQAIARMKVDEITRWRRDRLRDVHLQVEDLVRPRVREGIGALEGAAGATALSELRERLAAHQVEGTQNEILVRPDGGILLTLDARVSGLEPASKELVLRVLATGQARIGEPFRCPACASVHMDVAAPVPDGTGRPVAVLILRTDPDDVLFPLVQSWPTPSPTAETLLVRRDGDDVLMLNVLRHRSGPALSLRIPLSRTEVPAVRAVLGHVGPFEGLDYRGVEVLGEILPVPSSTWYMVSKVDRNELLAEVRYRGGVILALVSLGILMTGVLGMLAYRSRSEAVYRRLLEAEQEKLVAEQQASVTLDSIGDGVIATDDQGRVTRLNPVAEALTGWVEGEAQGRSLAEVFPIVNEDTRAPVENPVDRVLREGCVVGLANHTVLVAKDGSERPIADSGAPIRDGTGRICGVVLVFRDQTEERTARSSLLESEREFRTLFEHMGAGCCLHEIVRDGGRAVDYRLLDVNPLFERILGIPRSRACGALASDLYGTGDAPFLDLYERVAGTGETASFEVVWGPQKRHLQVTASGLGPDHFVTIFMDVTDRRQAEELLRASERQLRALYEESPLGYQSLDEVGVVRDVNPRWLEMMGYGRDEVVGRDFADFLAPEEVPLFRERFPRFKAAGQVRGVEFTMVRRDGSLLLAEIDGRIGHRPNGDFLQTHCMVRDVTEARRQEAERLRFEAVARQQQKLESIGTLASGVAHEINNPLNVILNYGQLLIDDPGNPERVRDFASNIVAESDRVAVIVRNLLSFARHEKEAHSPARLEDIVERTLSLTRSVLRKDQIGVEVSIPEGIPTVRCRSQQIQQVLMNLLTNARDALNDKYPKGVADKVIRIAASSFDREGVRWVRLTVEDHGPGIPPEIAARMFDPFFTTKPRDKGTGLGLSISYGIVREHHGELWFETEPGQRTAFHVDLRVDNGWSLQGEG